jgi:hypothetical protein
MIQNMTTAQNLNLVYHFVATFNEPHDIYMEIDHKHIYEFCMKPFFFYVVKFTNKVAVQTLRL